MTTRPSEITKASAANGATMPGSESVKVAVRIRPMSKSEQERGCQTVVEQAAPGEPQIVVCGGRTQSDIFSYSYVFPPTTAQSALYEQSVAPMLPKLFAGYNVTILAYGQTSSGKTFTMGTHFTGEMERDSGVIPRAINDILRMIATEAEAGSNPTPVDTRLSCSFIEVYQDQVYDLLAEKVGGTERQTVEIREAVSGNIVLQGLTEVSVENDTGAFDCLARGSAGRVVRATAMNNVSSRSHAIFTLTLHHTARDDPSVVTRSKFHLVDLAGSERSKKTSTTGDRFKEGVEINKCLLALGNVITALASSAGPGKAHIPYRSSKLTRLLQDSLGGNSYTLMIACVSPSDYNLSETYSTLRYACRVCKIKNKPIINQDPQQVRIKQLEGIIQDLRLEVLSLKSGGEAPQDGEFRVPKTPADRSPLMRGHTETDLLQGIRKPGGNGTREDHNALRLQKQQDTIRNLQLQLQSTLLELEASEMRAVCAEKLVEDIEKMLQQEEVEGTAKEERQVKGSQLGALLSAYKDELFTLSNSSESFIAPPHFARPLAPGGASGDPARQQEIERKSEFHTQQQMRIHNELTQLKRELVLKEELHRKCQKNSAQVASITSNREQRLAEQLRDYESQIRTLEEQLSELNAQLENTKASEKRSKLAEERRRKVQQLDAELAELRQKCARQAKLLKLNEKDAQRIAGLSAEIQQMKQTRVKLLKTLRTENEAFRQWKQERQKEITQLKAKDRKRQFELQKIESTYTLQKRIMQRKMDETIVVNKRLKALLERRQNYIKANNTSDRAKMRGAEAAAWIKQELELLYNTVDGTVTQKMLRIQRAHQTKKIDELKDQLDGLIEEAGEGSMEQPAGPQQKELVAEINLLLRDRDYRNAQLIDLQRKINAMDAENHAASFSEGLAKLPESREAFQQVLAQLVQIQTTLIEAQFRLVDLQATSDCQEEELVVLRNRLQAAEQQYRENVVQLEKTYEDKLSLLLMQRAAGWTGTAPNGGENKPDDGEGETTPGTGNDATDTVLEEAIRRIEELREELELYKESDQILRQQLDELTKPKPRKRRRPAILMDPDTEYDLAYGDDDEIELESSGEDERDPDFRGTPLWKRKKSESIRKTMLSSTLQSNNATTVGRQSSANVNGQPAGCCCAGNCSTRRCGCHKQDNICTAACKCPPGCVNRILPSIKDDGPMETLDGSNGDTSASDAANVTGQPDTSVAVENKENRTDQTFLIPKVPDAPMTPQQIEDREKLDILTYVAKYRKRKPLIDI